MSKISAATREVIAVTGYHHKHAIRVFRGSRIRPPSTRTRPCIYDEAPPSYTEPDDDGGALLIWCDPDEATGYDWPVN